MEKVLLRNSLTQSEKVCQQVADTISNQDDVHPPLLSRLLKYAVLKKKRGDMMEKETLQKDVAGLAKQDKPKKGMSSGRASKAAKKGKETPSLDVPPTVPVPPKPMTLMVKRGEEDGDLKYINDEPADGPSCFILVTGFTSADMYKELSDVNVRAHALVWIGGAVTPLIKNASYHDASEATFNKEFSSEILSVINSSMKESMLRDMALLELSVPQAENTEQSDEIGQQLFDSLAMRLYLLLEQYSQYQQYMRLIDLQPLTSENLESEKSSSAYPCDDALYRNVLSGIPEECCTIPLIMDAMLEQVCLCKSINTVEFLKENTLEHEISDLLQELKIEDDGLKQVPMISATDGISRTFVTSLTPSEQIRISDIHRKMILLSDLARYIFPSSSSNFQEEASLKLMRDLSSSDEITVPHLEFALLIMSLECLLFPICERSTSTNHKLMTSKRTSPFQVSETKASFLQNLESFCVQQLISKEELMQTLQSIQETHPYMCVYHCKNNNANVIVAHTGYDGCTACTSNVSIVAASNVGFQSYLVNLAEKYGSYVELFSSTERLHKSEQVQPIINSSLETSSQQSEFKPDEKTIGAPEATKLSGYDFDGRAIIGEESMDTFFMTGGIVAHSRKYMVAEGCRSVMVSVLHEHHIIRSSLQWKDIETQSELTAQFDNLNLPPNLLSASLYASIENDVALSLSCYGPKANGNLPYLPTKPKILEEQSTSPSSQSLPQFGSSPLKLSKKQQEQQQQHLLEHHRLLDEQHMKQKEAAGKQYQAKCEIISINNKDQQLFATTKAGLHIHCQILHDSEECSPGVAVCQGYTCSEKTSTKRVFREEKQRCYLPNGYIVRFLIEGTIIVVCPGGSIFETATKTNQDLFEKQYIINGTTDPSQLEAAADIRSSEAADKCLCIPQNRKIWLVTTPLGKRYLWKGEDYSDSSSNIEGDEQESIPTQQNDVNSTKNKVFFLQPLNVFKTTDPVSQEEHISREDGATLLYKPDGSSVIQFVDGIRCTAVTKFGLGVTTVLTESPGYANISTNVATGICTVNLSGTVKISCSADGSYSVSTNKSCCLNIDAKGKVVYRNGDEQYSLNHNGVDDILTGCDSEGHDSISVDRLGKGSCVKFNNGDSTAAFEPRFFTIDRSGQCAELLDADCLHRHPSVHAVVDKEVLAIGTVTTIMEQHKEHQQPMYKLQAMVPDNISDKSRKTGCDQVHGSIESERSKKIRFGTSVGNGLDVLSHRHYIGAKAEYNDVPQFITYKRYIQKQSVTSEIKENVLALIGSYLTWVSTTNSENVLKERISSEQETGYKMGVDKDKLFVKYNQACSCKAIITLNCSREILPQNMTIQNIMWDQNHLKNVLRKQHVPVYSFVNAELNKKEICSSLPNKAKTVSTRRLPPFLTKDVFSSNGSITSTEKVSKTRTAGAICVLPTTPLSLLQQVEISPSEINFGTLQEGGKYHVSLTLKNVGVHPCRFRIRQPHPATGLKVRYSPGQIAPGMSRLAIVELYATKSDGGELNHTLEICTEKNTQLLLIKANILSTGYAKGTIQRLERSNL
ncbi:sperm-associated antigen 17-like isoform X3 [Halichondria panicea]|uniref:sperm-associated antigen 17-like isoform X3 n=1 Tax=Halichondria panicea TaxID=6063 RepID=UPI00312BB0AE